MFISQEIILNETNNGLDIIQWQYPDSIGCEANPKKKFKARGAEKTASANLSFYNGIWWAIDYGGDQKSRNPIEVVMFEQNCDYKEALELIARHFNIKPENGKLPDDKPKYIFEERSAEPDEAEDTLLFDIREGFTVAEIKSIFTEKVIAYAEEKARKNNKDILPEEIEKRYAHLFSVLKKYHFFGCKSYTKIKNRKALIFTATDEHPIFTIEEKGFKKIYQPMHTQKQYRFMYDGKREENFIHGYAQCLKAYEKLNPIEPDEKENYDKADEDEKKEKRKEKKLEQIIICTGGSDALNVAALDYEVIWMNSETAKLPWKTYTELKRKCKHLCNLPDIDITGQRAGHELSMQHLDIRTIKLPTDLQRHRDWRGNPCKDVRDYFKHYTIKSFKSLVETALPYQFWNEEFAYNRKTNEPIMVGGRQKVQYQVSNVPLYNFLQNNGFWKFNMNENNDDHFIKITGNVVKEIEPKEVRFFINDFLEERKQPVDLRNTFYRSNQLGDGSFSNIKTREIDFKDHDKDCQFLFFKNKTWEVRSTGIKEHRPGDVKKYVWNDEVIDHRVELMEDFFKVDYDFANDSYNIDIKNNSSLFFRYLINASRMYWREELETRQPDPVTAAAYFKEHQFNIAGPGLSPEEKQIQMHHLVNKIYSIGYLLHRHKDVSKAWCVFAMDNKLSPDNEAHGGSGKSLCFNQGLPKLLIKNFYKDGRNKELTNNPHVFDGLTEYHRYIIIDDAHKYLDLQFFFGKITGHIEVNPKQKKPYIIPFEKSGKMAITSNYAPRNPDPSTARRLLYFVVSDYYHYNKDNEYAQTRLVSDDFNKNLFTDYTDQEWNLDFNFFAQCLRFYLSHERKVEPPMDNVKKRHLLDKMGTSFRGWADEYFGRDELSPDSCNLDKYIPKKEMFKDFSDNNKKSLINMHGFTAALKAWCQYNNLVYNPKDLCNQDGRILQEHAGKTTEMVYIMEDPGKLIELVNKKNGI